MFKTSTSMIYAFFLSLLLTACDSQTTNPTETSSLDQNLTTNPSNDINRTAYDNAKPYDDYTDYAANLSTCTVYEEQFQHPFVIEVMTRKILGYQNGFCIYTETMPQDALMTCTYDEVTKDAVAGYLTLLDNATSYSTQLVNGEVVYTVDGVVVDNPLANAIDDGTCEFEF